MSDDYPRCACGCGKYVPERSGGGPRSRFFSSQCRQRAAYALKVARKVTRRLPYASPLYHGQQAK